MTFTLKKTVPNPNGNPNFRRQWENLDETAPVKLPKELHPFFKELTTAINSGAISVTQLKSLCNGDDQQSDILQILQQFENETHHAGASTTSSRYGLQVWCRN